MTDDIPDAPNRDPEGTAVARKVAQDRVEPLRGWLERNKIFFDTIAAVALAALAIVVGSAQYSVRKDQLRLAEAENQPLLLWRLEAGEFVLLNEGRRASGFEMRLAIQVEISALEHGQFPRTYRARRRVIQAESLYWPENRSVGEILSFPAASLGSKTDRLKEVFEAQEGGWSSQVGVPCEFDVKVLAEVTYADLGQETRSQYFLMEPAFGFPRLEDRVGARSFAAIESLEPLESAEAEDVIAGLADDLVATIARRELEPIRLNTGLGPK